MDIARLYTGDDGETHIEEMSLESHPALGELQKATGIVFRTAEPGSFLDWHPAPRRQFVITISGEVEIGLWDGTVHRFATKERTELGLRTASAICDALGLRLIKRKER